MTRRFLVAVLCPVALLTSVAVAAFAAAAPSPHAQVLVLDAIYTHTRTAGPGPANVGHRQTASGILRDAGGQRVGTFTFTCTWTKVERGGATERCAGSAFTPDGRLDAAGPSESSDPVHTWRLTGGAGRYRASSGILSVRDLGDAEALLSATVTTPAHIDLHAGKVTRPAANETLIARAEHLCRRAAAGLAALPPFPLANFDPLHPDPHALAAVGAFFTGSGDPRPILGTLDAALRGLGTPAGQRGVWQAALRARAGELAVINAQDRAALGGDVPGFVRSVHESAANFRQIAITATVFGAPSCIL